MVSKVISRMALVFALALLVSACAPAAPAPTPTAAKPAAPTPTAAAAKPAASPAAPTAAATGPAAVPTKAVAPAGDFPNKPISILIPYPAGGSSDVGARIVAALMEKELGQPVQVVNKAGAGGQVGWTELAKSKPDGYTIGGINLPHLPAVVVDPQRKAVFKQEDIVPIVSQAVDPTQVAVRGDSPYKTLKELVEDAQKRPKQLKAGIVGILNDDEVGYLQMVEAGKFEMSPVRFDGSAPCITALLGGHIDVTFCTVGDNFVQAKAGKIKPLAVMDKERTKKFFPDVPTAKEAGYSELLSSSTRGFAVPKGVPEPIMKKLEDALTRAMKDPEHISKIEEAGQPVVIMNRAEFTKAYDASFQTIEKWIGKAIKTD